MAYIMLPQQERTRSGWEDFSAGLQPGLQQAMNLYLQQKFADMQRQRNLEQARQVVPQLFTETTPASAYQRFLPQGTELNLAGGLAPERQTEVARQLTQAKGIKIPERVRKFAFKSEGLQPSIDITTGQVSLKPEDAFQAYYRSLLPTKSAEGKPTQAGAGLVPLTPDEAIENFMTQNPDVKREDIRVTPKPIPGQKGIAYYEASVSPEAEVVKKKEAELQRETKKSVGEFRGFIEQFERSYDELTGAFPSIGATGMGGYGIRSIASLGEKVGSFPETSAFLRELKPKANQMARTIEGGRVTDEDRKIYADSFANVLATPSQTNIRLVANSLINAQRKGGDISVIMGALRVSDNEIMQGIVNEVEQNIPDLQQPQGFDFSQSSTDELLRRRQQLLQGGGQ